MITVNLRKFHIIFFLELMRIEKVSKNWRVLNSKQAIPAFKKKKIYKRSFKKTKHYIK